MTRSFKLDHRPASAPASHVLAPNGSKADTLAMLAGRLRVARLPLGVAIEWRLWQSDRMSACARVLSQLGRATLAVRSSRRGEDCPGAANAGRYLSLIGIASENLTQAIDSVFASYGQPNPRDQVLVQRCIEPVSEALVAANCAPGDGAAYDAISRAKGPCSAAITAGTVAAETLYLAHGSSASVDALTARVRSLLREIEALIGTAPFELELVRSGRTLWLLQLRLLNAAGSPSRKTTDKARARATAAHAHAQRTDHATVLGLMPDWNPAELLGEHPRPLAMDVFRRLIARDTWWQARTQLGYRRPMQRDLILPLGGRPYVNVMASFESLLPAALDTATAKRVTAAWSHALCTHPALHDRVETAVALTCAEFDGDRRLRAHGIERADRRRLLATLGPLTQAMLDPGRIRTRGAQLEALACRQWDTPITPRAVKQALQRLRTAVALPFAQAARVDFVIAALLQSSVRLGAMDAHQVDALRGSVRSAAGELMDELAVDDQAALRERRQSLRPGTFEIGISTLTEWVPQALVRSTSGPHSSVTEVSASRRGELDRLLRERAPYLDADTLIALAPLAARAREIGKLALARGISAILGGLTAWGVRHALDREQLGWLSLDVLLRHADAAPRLQESAQRNASRHVEDAGLRMPAVLAAGDTLDAVRCAANTPSFIGNAAATGRIHRVDRGTTPQQLPPGAIVAIESADPGFDWIFARHPVALITAFGGPHSHMALRCAELGIAAALGLGLSRFRRLAEATSVQLDPLRGAINIVGPRS
jgi:hypothetical protein